MYYEMSHVKLSRVYQADQLPSIPSCIRQHVRTIEIDKRLVHHLTDCASETFPSLEAVSCSEKEACVWNDLDENVDLNNEVEVAQTLEIVLRNRAHQPLYLGDLMGFAEQNPGIKISGPVLFRMCHLLKTCEVSPALIP